MAVSKVSPQPAASYDTGAEGMCPYRLVLEHVTSRWGVLVLIELLERPYRFSELRRAIGRVSEKMLTQHLREMEADALVAGGASPRSSTTSIPSRCAPWRAGPGTAWTTWSGPAARTTKPGAEAAPGPVGRSSVPVGRGSADHRPGVAAGQQR